MSRRYRSSANRFLLTLTLATLGLGPFLSPAQAAPAYVSGGTVVISYNETAFSSVTYPSPAIPLFADNSINSFNQTSSNTLTSSEILTDLGTFTAWTNINFGINPTTPQVNPTGRNLQSTSFSYDPLNLTGSASGQIGIGGTSRWVINPALGGGPFVLGDFALTYGGSTWSLANNFAPAAPAFYLSSPSLTSVSDTGFTLSGTLYASTTLQAFFGFAPDTSYGTISLTATAVPEPATAALLLLGTVSSILICRRRSAEGRKPATHL